MRNSISPLWLFFLLIFLSCQKETDFSFIVGDDTYLTQVNSTEGGSVDVPINKYSDNLPHDVGLTWNELSGMKGQWSVTLQYNAQNNTDPKTVIQFQENGRIIHEVQVTRLGDSTKQRQFSFYAQNGKIKVSVVSKSCEVGVRLVFNR